MATIKQEVESVIGRELIGHEKAIISYLSQGGMVNPIDLAREMFNRHINNANTRLNAIQNEIDDLESALARLSK